MKKEISLQWKEKMAFQSEVDGHVIIVDANREFGGTDSGPRPKSLLLVSLAGCTAMDVIAILNKMKVEVKSFNIKVEGEVEDQHPQSFKNMHVIYEFSGENLPMEKLQKAVELSQEKYCGVSATLKKGIPVTYEIRII